VDKLSINFAEHVCWCPKFLSLQDLLPTVRRRKFERGIAGTKEAKTGNQQARTRGWTAPGGQTGLTEIPGPGD
jgi:hypothetical protein